MSCWGCLPRFLGRGCSERPQECVPSQVCSRIPLLWQQVGMALTVRIKCRKLWDVAITGGTPLVGNELWGSRTHQDPHSKGLNRPQKLLGGEGRHLKSEASPQVET